MLAVLLEGDHQAELEHAVPIFGPADPDRLARDGPPVIDDRLILVLRANLGVQVLLDSLPDRLEVAGQAFLEFYRRVVEVSGDEAINDGEYWYTQKILDGVGT